MCFLLCLYLKMLPFHDDLRKFFTSALSFRHISSCSTFPFLQGSIFALQRLVIGLGLGLVVRIMVLWEVRVGQSLAGRDSPVTVQHQHTLQQVHGWTGTEAERREAQNKAEQETLFFSFFLTVVIVGYDDWWWMMMMIRSLIQSSVVTPYQVD